MEGFVAGDVIVIDFPFSNLKGSKRRPVFVVKVPKGADIIVNQITGESYEPSAEIKITDKDFKQGSLKRDSFIRVDKIATIERSLIKYKIGSLRNERSKEIIDEIIAFLVS